MKTTLRLLTVCLVLAMAGAVLAAKTSVDQWDTTAGLNTDVGGINIDEGMATGDVNNAVRELMAQIKTFSTSLSTPIQGLVPNSAADADHDITISAGRVSDTTATLALILSSALTKQLDAAWAEGNNAGGLPGGSPAADTWYHVFVIGKTDGTTDAGFDTSLTASTLLAAAAGYTLYRRVGSVRTDSSSNIIAFVATELAGGGLFVEWVDPPLDQDGAVGTSAATVSLTVPTGYKVMATLNAMAQISSGHASVYVRSTAANDEAPSQSAAPLANLSGLNSSSGVGQAQLRVMTSTSRQITVRSDSASTTVRLATMGWEDQRR